MKRNIDIRNEIKDAGLYMWKIAYALDINDSCFSKMLRKELDDTTKQRIRDIIKHLKANSRSG